MQWWYFSGTNAPETENMLYSGTRYNLAVMGHRQATTGSKVLSVADLIPSILMDTLVLPLTIGETVFEALSDSESGQRKMDAVLER